MPDRPWWVGTARRNVPEAGERWAVPTLRNHDKVGGPCPPYETIENEAGNGGRCPPYERKAILAMATHTETVGPEKRVTAHGTRKIECVVVTPEKTLFDEQVDFVALPLYDGELGILPGRTPLIGRLGFGELRTNAGEAVKRYFVDGGFVQVRDDVVTILTNRAVPAQQLDTAAAAKELETLETQRVADDLEFAEHEKAIARVRGLMRVARHRKEG